MLWALHTADSEGGHPMRTFDNTSRPTGIAGHLPAGAMPLGTTSYVLAPGASGWVDRHVEMELCVVVSGTAMVEVASRIARVEQGGAFFFEGMESHVVHNDSADTPLVIVSARWTPAGCETTPRLDDLAAAVAGFALAA